jgi:hypothetical protein
VKFFELSQRVHEHAALDIGLLGRAEAPAVAFVTNKIADSF